MDGSGRVEWPEGRAFAFTVFDDTDLATVENVGPVYAFLRDLGLRTTKSVWAIAGDGVPSIGGATCDDPAYRDWTLELQAAGFEIGSHGASPTTSPRDVVARSLNRFREIYGHYPDALANHYGCRESIYWGEDRVSGTSRLAYNLMTGFRRRGQYRGHREGDPLFWGDLCRERIRFVRNFTYADVNTLAACPVMPYYDPDRPYLRAWFASSEGANVEAFCRCLGEAEQDRLEAEGGACIMYTHFASGFWADGELNQRFRELMRRLACKNGWFVPVTALLDCLVEKRGLTVLTAAQRGALERRWLRSKIRVGHS
ncbi:MAG: hypothetical protein ABSA21_07445 [Candidatus Limnocylindrales bacterium]